MKKYLVVLAVLAIVFAGCKKDEKTEYTKLAFKQTEIKIAEGQSTKINVLYEPTTLDAPTCTWSTSNAAVATVDNGTVTGVTPGEANITATLGDLTAVCKVTVTTIYGAYEIEDYSVFLQDSIPWIEGTDTTFNLSWAGGSFHCRMAYWPVIAWDGNVTFVNGSGFQGEGYLLYARVPFWTVDDATAGDNNETPFGWGSFSIKKPTDKVRNNVAEAGQLDGDKWSEYIASYIDYLLGLGGAEDIKFDLLDEAFSGTSIFVADYTSDDPTWELDYGLFSGVVKDMTLKWDADAEDFYYAADIDWLDSNDEDPRFYGVKYDESGAIQPYDLNIISEHHVRGDVYGSSVSNEPKPVKFIKEKPEIRMGRKVVTDKLMKR